jgi:hypothetical protein
MDRIRTLLQVNFYEAKRVCEKRSEQPGGKEPGQIRPERTWTAEGRPRQGQFPGMGMGTATQPPECTEVFAEARRGYGRSPTFYDTLLFQRGGTRESAVFTRNGSRVRIFKEA